MGSHTSLFSFSCLFLFLLLSEQTGILAEARFQHDQLNDVKPTKLFVFGDSYVDTGNTDAIEPYGITCPGYPDGRWSDGRILTDFIAHYLGLKSPVPYNKSDDCPGDLKYGMNFAVGGTGVFDIPNKGPNMTAQIHMFQKIIEENVYNASDLNNSVAYVSAAGNDYLNYFIMNPGSFQPMDILVFIAEVVYQISQNLLRIQELGVNKIVVGDLPPLDCIPVITNSSSFTHCNDTVGLFVFWHNLLLNILVQPPSFQILHLHDSFKSVINNSSKYGIPNPLTPCCVGVSGGNYTCGSTVEETGEKKYTVCDEPESAFYWDVVHPTQAGWKAVYNELQKKGALQVFYGTNLHASY